METLKYTVIKNREQYNHYCDLLFQLELEYETIPEANSDLEEELLLLEVLIDDYDRKNSHQLPDLNPIELLVFLKKENGLNSQQLADALNISKSLLSNILHYRRALSKELIQKLAAYFKLSQEALNKPYHLVPDEKKKGGLLVHFSKENSYELPLEKSAKVAEKASEYKTKQQQKKPK